MSAPPDVAACPRCGDASPLGALGGLCPTCLARSALAAGHGWLAPTPRVREAWPELPGWRITGLLGAGGMGSVYRAESEADASPAAIKVLALRWSHDPLIAARFEAEADALRQLAHPHIVRVLDFTETEDDRLCLVMELVDGCDLARLLRAEKLAPERAAELFDKVCAAVAHAHERGFLHRDIKPSNILVGRDGTVKLADFGLAKDLADSATQIGGLTATTDQFGTAYYLAPERMLAGKKSGPPTDVFSLGVLLYHLFAGQMPVGNFTPLSQLTHLPREVDTIISRALEADPERRTANVIELRTSFAATWRKHRTGANRALRTKQIAALATTVVVAAAIGAWAQHQRMKPAPPLVHPAPSTATTAQPWENSIGMKFVPIPGTKVLFSIWETRRRDFALHRADDAANFTPWREDHFERARAKAQSVVTFGEGGTITKTGTWQDPGWPVTPDHPAGGINIRVAQRFCQWLTWKDQLAGRLPLGWHYRLPTHAEWLSACGGESATVHPGNVAGEEARDANWPDRRATLPQRDLFPRSAPVGSFPPELHGLYDISGNLTEWVVNEDEDTSTRDAQSNAELRGPCFIDGTPEHVRFSYLRQPFRVARLSFAGFRVVLEPPQEAPKEE